MADKIKADLDRIRNARLPPDADLPPLTQKQLERIAAHMNRAYEEIVEFIAAGTTARTVAQFEPSQQTRDRVADLIHREKTTGLTPSDASELNHYLELEHLMRLAKARAQSYCSDD